MCVWAHAVLLTYWRREAASATAARPAASRAPGRFSSSRTARALPPASYPLPPFHPCAHGPRDRRHLGVCSTPLACRVKGLQLHRLLPRAVVEGYLSGFIPSRHRALPSVVIAPIVQRTPRSRICDSIAGCVRRRRHGVAELADLLATREELGRRRGRGSTALQARFLPIRAPALAASAVRQPSIEGRRVLLATAT